MKKKIAIILAAIILNCIMSEAKVGNFSNIVTGMGIVKAAETDETKSNENITSETTHSVSFPTNVIAYLDPGNISGRGQVFSEKYKVENYGSADIAVKIKSIEAYCRFTEKLDIENEDEDSTLRKLNVNMVWENEDEEKVLHVTEDITDEYVVLLKSSEYDENGNFLQLNDDSEGVFYFTGELDHCSDSIWENSKIEIRFDYEVVDVEEDAGEQIQQVKVPEADVDTSSSGSRAEDKSENKTNESTDGELAEDKKIEIEADEDETVDLEDTSDLNTTDEKADETMQETKEPEPDTETNDIDTSAEDKSKNEANENIDIEPSKDENMEEADENELEESEKEADLSTTDEEPDEEIEAEDDGIYNISFPEDAVIHLGSEEIKEGEISSEEYVVENYSDQDIAIKIKNIEVYYRTTEELKKISEETADSQSEVKEINLNVAWKNKGDSTEKVLKATECISDEPVLYLKAAEFDENGELVQLSDGSIGLFYLTGILDMEQADDWNEGEIIVHFDYEVTNAVNEEE